MRVNQYECCQHGDKLVLLLHNRCEFYIKSHFSCFISGDKMTAKVTKGKGYSPAPVTFKGKIYKKKSSNLIG